MRRLQSCWRGQMVTLTLLSSGCVCVSVTLPWLCRHQLACLVTAAPCQSALPSLKHVYTLQMEESMRMKQERLVSEPSGAPGAMQVSFRGVDPFNTWVSMCTLPPCE